LRFLRKIHREFPGRFILLIVDCAPTHTAKIVKKFSRENEAWLRLEILPAYSPELNPTEKSWRYVKTKKLNASAAKDKLELRSKVKKSIRETKKDRATVASFFSEL
jgi:transposase